MLHSFCTLCNFVRNRNIWCFSTLSVHNICRYYTSCPYRFPAFVTDLLLRSVPVTPRQIRENAPRITDVGLTVEHLHTYPNIYPLWEIYLPTTRRYLSNCSIQLTPIPCLPFMFPTVILFTPVKNWRMAEALRLIFLHRQIEYVACHYCNGKDREQKSSYHFLCEHRTEQ